MIKIKIDREFYQPIAVARTKLRSAHNNRHLLSRTKVYQQDHYQAVNSSND